MAKRFITQREINFIDSIDRELIQYVVGQEIRYYAILVPETHPHRLYNEAIKKTWAPPVRINARVKWDNQNTKTTQAGLDSNYSAEVYFHKKELKLRNVVPREGDFLEFGKVVFEITSVSEPDLIFGQVNQKTQIKCVCIPSREGQMYVSNLVSEGVDNTTNVDTSDVDPSFSTLQTRDGPFGTTTKVIHDGTGGTVTAGDGLYTTASGSTINVGAGQGIAVAADSVAVDIQTDGGLDFFSSRLGVRIAVSGNLAKGSDGLYVLSGTSALHGNLSGGSLHSVVSSAGAGFAPSTSGYASASVLSIGPSGTVIWSPAASNADFISLSSSYVSFSSSISSFSSSLVVHETRNDIRINVHTTGSDAVSALRITDVDTPSPLATVQKAIDLIPRWVGHRVLVKLGSGSFTGSQMFGYAGGGPGNTLERGVYFVGATVPAVISGTLSGTVGVGSMATTIQAPAGSPGWVSGALRGHFLQIVGGSGSSGDSELPVTRPILGNGTGSFYFDSVTGIGPNTQFRIVDLASTMVLDPTSPVSGSEVCMTVHSNNVPVTFYNVRFYHPSSAYGVYSSRNSVVRADGCLFDESDVSGFYSYGDNSIEVVNSIFTHTSSLETKNTSEVRAKRLLLQDGGNILIRNVNDADVSFDSYRSHTNAFFCERGVHVTLAAAATSGAASPVYLESIVRFENGGISGEANQGYGVEINNGGNYDLTGVTVTATSGNLLVEGVSGTYAELASEHTFTADGTVTTVTG